MKGSTVALIVIGVAAVGGGAYFFLRQRDSATGTGAKKTPTTTTDKVIATIGAALPVGLSVAKLWS